jgi:hypothetical protein
LKKAALLNLFFRDRKDPVDATPLRDSRDQAVDETEPKPVGRIEKETK